MKEPKFKIGDAVRMSSPTLYNETEGVITGIERKLKKLDSHCLERGVEVFEDGGLVTLESSINSISLPYDFDGTYLRVTYPKGTLNRDRDVVTVSKVFGYSYVIKSPKMNSIYPEKSLKVIHSN